MPRPFYWITVHWPHPDIEGDDELPWNVYLRDEYHERGFGDDLEADDSILFYQTAQARDANGVLGRVSHIPSGKSVKLKLHPNGLVGAGVALEKISPRARSRIHFKYGEGDPYQWKWEARCKTKVFRKGLSHTTVKGVLGYSLMFPSGLRKIDRANYERLLDLLQRQNKSV